MMVNETSRDVKRHFVYLLSASLTFDSFHD